MTDTSRSPSRELPLFPTLVALLCAGAAWFTAAFLLPKAFGLSRMYPSFEPLPWKGDAVLGNGWLISMAAIAAGGVAIAIFAGACFARKRGAGTAAWRWASHILALTTLGASAWLSLVVFFGMHSAWLGAHTQRSVFRNVLDEFALRETAEGRFDRIAAALKANRGGEAIPIWKEEDLPPPERQSRVSRLVIILDKEITPQMRRRVLATIPMFRSTLARRSYDRDVVLKHAREESGQTFEDLDTFFAWLASAPKADGWEPIQLYRLNGGGW